MIEHPGRKIGNYQLVRKLGSGGFAFVYLGEHIYLHTQAAIKILQTRLAQDSLTSFLQEAQIIAGLAHPNIIQVFDFGVEEKTPFLVMAYAPNGTLRQRHPIGTRVSLKEIAGYITQVAEGLQYAHDRKIIHRDIKPENMLIGQDGKILLSDFGIAVVSQSSRYQGKQEIGGTVAYMAPEQLQGKADITSDQYALGIVAYEWLTGQRPFNGSFAEVGSQHLFTPPPSLLKQVPDLKPTVEQVIFTALNKDPQKRFMSVRAFAIALSQCVDVTYKASKILDEQNIPTVQKTPANLVNTRTSDQPYQGAGLSITLSLPTQAVSTPVFTASTPQSGGWSRTPDPTLLSQPHRSKKLIVAIIALILLLIGVSSASLVYILAQKMNTNPVSSINAASNTATQSAAIGVPTVHTDTPTLVVLPSPTSTPSSTTITKPLHLTCIVTNGSCGTTTVELDVTLNTIIINAANNRMEWNFTIKNTGTEADLDMRAYTLYLEDPSGTQYKAGQPGTFTESNPITAGQTLQEYTSFSFLPTPGVKYTLHLTTYLGGPIELYQTETFSF